MRKAMIRVKMTNFARNMTNKILHIWKVIRTMEIFKISICEI